MKSDDRHVMLNFENKVIMPKSLSLSPSLAPSTFRALQIGSRFKGICQQEQLSRQFDEVAQLDAIDFVGRP